MKDYQHDYEQDLKVWLRNLRAGQYAAKNKKDPSEDFLEWVTNRNILTHDPLYQRMYNRRWALPKHLWASMWSEWPLNSEQLQCSEQLRQRRVRVQARTTRGVAEVGKEPVDAGTIRYEKPPEPRQNPSITIPLPTLAGVVSVAQKVAVVGLPFAVGVVVGQVA